MVQVTVHSTQQASLRFDMADIGAIYNSWAVESTETTYVTKNYYEKMVFRGKFSYPNYRWTGIINSIEYFYREKLMISWKGLHENVGKYLFWAWNDYTDSAYRTMFKGNDTFEGGNLRDVIYGYAGNDTLIASGGNDTLEGGAGRDALTGNGGDDRLDGGGDGDRMSGGDGNDTYIVDHQGDSLEDNGSGWDTVVASLSWKLGANLEILTAANGLSKSVTLTGNSRSNRITGGRGADVLLGEDGEDTLIGGSGADTLLGGAGRDVLTGNDGRDVFVIGTAGSEPSRITDFKLGVTSGDKLDFRLFFKGSPYRGSTPVSAGLIRLSWSGGKTILEARTGLKYAWTKVAALDHVASTAILTDAQIIVR